MRRQTIRRVLIANRGEIARRIIRAAHDMGIEAIAVFAEDDRSAPHVTEADRAVSLGTGPLALTYLDVASIMAAAEQSGADAVHPGYGFLSEAPALAQACESAGIVWVGPPAEAMTTMGDKVNAKATVAAAGVPVLESRVVRDDLGADGLDRSPGAPAELQALGDAVGFPLLVKASAGGGGRGMRVVERPKDLAEAVDAARREALGAFGSPSVFLERYVTSPRHVEVQVLADRHGAVVHLFDRDCSVQRRHQKVVEEAPASSVPDGVRRLMWQAAVDATRAVGYEGAGTVEFLVDGDLAWFLEMNTRLQVEHGVTELVTGIDLVQLQFGVAGGHPLPFAQRDVTVAGHAVEVRVCAEDPRHGYRPTPGIVRHARWPSGPGIRVDAGVETGSVVSPAYDSLVAKIMAVAGDRPTALATLRRALTELELDGVASNRALLTAVLAEDDFVGGRVSTRYLDTHPQVVDARLDVAATWRHVTAASLFLLHRRAASSIVTGVPPAWRNVGHPGHRDGFTDGEEQFDVALVNRGGPAGAPSSFDVSVWQHPAADQISAPIREVGPAFGDPAWSAQCHAQVIATSGALGRVELEIDGVQHPLGVRVADHLVSVSSPDGQSSLSLYSEDERERARSTAGECRAPLPGSVVKVLVAEGDTVEEGSGLVVLEAMKMEHTLRAAGPGVVGRIAVGAGAQVDVGDLLATVRPVEPAG